ncbi:MAG: FAD/NAD(P)-binding protein [Promethearchaeati archaeon SRVP18_Atabeyarchaeia-1]
MNRSIETKTESPYISEPCKILRRTDLAEGVRLFQIRPINENSTLAVNYSPGQFVMVSVPGIGEAPISISSTPTRPGTLDLGIRNVGRLTEAVLQLKEKDTMFVRGPYGNNFNISAMEGKDLLIVAGGIGMIPLRSVLLFSLDNRELFKRVIFLYGARTPDERLFKADLDELKERGDVECHYSVDRDPTGKWPGKVGVVTTLFADLQDINPDSTSVVICGPPVMYTYVIRELLKIKIPKNQIQMTLERRMKCGIGKCGHCAVDELYVCRDGPVFTYWDVMHSRELI